MLFETSSTNELKITISILRVSSLIIPFRKSRDFPSLSCSTSVYKLYTKPVTSTISYIAYSLITCSNVKGFDCDVFLSKLSSISLADEKSCTIMSLLLSPERKRLISIPERELSFMMSLNSWCFSGEEQTP